MAQRRLARALLQRLHEPAMGHVARQVAALEAEADTRPAAVLQRAQPARAELHADALAPRVVEADLDPPAEPGDGVRAGLVDRRPEDDRTTTQRLRQRLVTTTSRPPAPGARRACPGCSDGGSRSRSSRRSGEIGLLVEPDVAARDDPVPGSTDAAPEAADRGVTTTPPEPNSGSRARASPDSPPSAAGASAFRGLVRRPRAGEEDEAIVAPICEPPRS